MKKLSLLFLVTIFSFASFTACEDFVTDTEPQIDVIEDELLNDPDQIPFLITGVEARFAFVYTRLTVSADLIAAQLVFDEVMDLATFPTYRDLNDAFANVAEQTIFSSNTIRGVYTPLGGYRLLADDLLERIAGVEGLDQATRDRATFVGNFYGAVARYFIGFYFAENPCGATAGIGSGGPECLATLGGPIDESAVITASAMMSEILPRLQAARAVASPYHARVINTLEARMHLFLGNYGEAFAAAQNGMTAGDDPFQGLHSVQASNQFYFAAGDGRIQVIPNRRFEGYIADDPDEANRVKLKQAPDRLVNDPEPRFQQDMYPVQESPKDFLTWQENELILAELEGIRGQGGGGQGSALSRVNNVRASHGIGPVAGPVDADLILLERDKELFLQSVRMFDLLRFNAWHATIPGTVGAGTSNSGNPIGPWRGLPIPNDERNQNPNIN